jgi:hypothetical protein
VGMIMGSKRLRELVVEFVEREKELAE